MKNQAALANLPFHANNREVHADSHQGLSTGPPAGQLRVLGVALCVCGMWWGGDGACVEVCSAAGGDG